jgi:DNA-binding IclR family transcriptional regulator
MCRVKGCRAEDASVSIGAPHLRILRVSFRSAPTSPGVKAAERGLAILDAFIERGTLGLADIAKATGLAKPTLLRLLASLGKTGYVVRLSDGRYQLGAKLMALGAVYRSNFKLDQHVLPVLEHLATVTRESATFHIREGDHRMSLFRVESPQAVRDVVKPATMVLLDETSTGSVLQAAAWPEPNEPLTIYCSSGVYDTQTASVSTAVFAAGPVLAGALTVSGPVGRFGAAHSREIAGQLAAAACGLSTVLGAPMILPSRRPRIIRLQPGTDAPLKDKS